jgi:TPR repeat protein
LDKKAAEQGNVNAQLYLATKYRSGEGVPKDYKKSAYWTKKAAEQGNVNAQYNLGYMYVKGQGVIKDYVEAYAWGNIVAAQGDKDAGNNRDMVARDMAPAQLGKAQELSKDYYQKYVK